MAVGLEQWPEGANGLVSGGSVGDAWGMDNSPKRDLEEVMEFDPEEGIADLERHLDRLKSKADSQGFKFDRHAVRNELQAATFGKQKSGKARLLLAPSGAIAIELKTT
jgi:para-aminobenzoate synthetase/4-amino-4-deoxychorismate lyase